MRNLKKFLALVLATLMMVSAAAVVSADFTDVAADNRYYVAINDLAVKGIVQGTVGSTFDPTADVTRTQMAIMLARTLSGETEDDARWAKGIVPYTDVTEYAGAIEYVQVKGLINGWTDITGKLVFGPKDNVTYVQALKMAIGALGYTEELAWPWGYYNKAVELGLTANMDVTELDAELNRAETAQIIYNVLYAEPAEGGLTIAEANFGIATAANTDLFVITATPKQFYAIDAENHKYDADASEVEGDYVGIQALVNGVPDGNMIYVPVEALGIAVADVENYFNYAVELVNYDKKTGDFDNAILGEAPVVVDNTKFVFVNDDKAKIDGKTYTTVDNITGATLNNEIVIYNGSIVADAAQMLVMDEDGYVYVDADDAVGKLAYTSSNGTKYYHVYTDHKNGEWVSDEWVPTADNKKGKIVSESTALYLWGVEVLDEAGAYVEYATMNARLLKDNAFQLSLFDDDRDGLYERAVYTPIYMGIYYTYKGEVDDKDTVCDGLVRYLVEELGVDEYADEDDDGIAATNVTYTDEAAKEVGAISVFTYNAQLNKVDVIDVLEMQTGTIDKINATGFQVSNNSPKNTVKVTVDGTVYTLAYDFRSIRAEDKGTPVTDYYVDGAKLGAHVNAIEKKHSDWTVEDLGEEIFLEVYGYGDADKEDFSKAGDGNEEIGFINEFNVNDKIGFYAYNGYILMADELEYENVFNFALVDEWSDFDLGEIYMDLWIAGEIEEDATVIEIDGKELADLSTARFSMLLSEDELFYPGTVYTLDIVDDTYALEELIDFKEMSDTDIENEYELHNAKFANDNYLYMNDGDETTEYVDTTEGTLVFDNGSTTGKKDFRLRTDDETVFYFVKWNWKEGERGANEGNKFDREVKVFTGDVADGVEIVFDEHTEIWTDSLGTGNDRADVVFVIDYVSETFFASDITYIIGSFPKQYSLETDDAADFGLPEEYEDEVMYAYNGTYIDVYTGEKVASTIYSTYKYNWKEGNSACRINEDNVIVDANGNWKDAEGKLERGEIEINKTTAAAEVGLTYIDAVRNYALYGLTNPNLNGNTTSTADKKLWGDADNHGYNMKGDLISGLETSENSVNVNYFDWYWANQNNWECGCETACEHEELPSKIYEVELVEPIFEIEYDEKNFELISLSIYTSYVDEDNNTKQTIISANDADDIELKVYKYGTTSAMTGKEAIQYLATAPMVWFAALEEGGVYDFTAMLADDCAEFYIFWDVADK